MDSKGWQAYNCILHSEQLSWYDGLSTSTQFSDTARSIYFVIRAILSAIAFVRMGFVRTMVANNDLPAAKEFLERFYDAEHIYVSSPPSTADSSALSASLSPNVKFI